MQIFFPWEVSKPFTGAYTLYSPSNMTSQGKKALGQSGLPRADWIAKSLLAAAPQMP
jgi:hypothetical protein